MGKFIDYFNHKLKVILDVGTPNGNRTVSVIFIILFAFGVIFLMIYPFVLFDGKLSAILFGGTVASLVLGFMAADIDVTPLAVILLSPIVILFFIIFLITFIISIFIPTKNIKKNERFHKIKRLKRKIWINNILFWKKFRFYNVKKNN